MTAPDTPILNINNLSVAFRLSNDCGQPEERLAIEDLSLDVHRGAFIGLVGESGCGKSLTSLAILGLLPKTAHIKSGHILFEGQDLSQLDTEAFRKLRGAEMALIPQDPMSSLNPVYSVGEQLAEVLVTHKGLSWTDAYKASGELLDKVRIPNAKERLNNYPHEFSGGMRQRAMIAMALSCRPKLLIADEPTTALDVTVQAQILELMKDLIKEDDTAILLITHDLGVVAEVCDDVAIMYAGQIVEKAAVKTAFSNPLHPYTKGLLASLPKAGQERLFAIPGQPPGLRLAQPGCPFAPRCNDKRDDCERVSPQLETAAGSHPTRCLLYSAPAEPTEALSH